MTISEYQHFTMIATLYVPNELPRLVPTEGLLLPIPPKYYAQVSPEVATLLGCAQGLVDILDCGPAYAAYSIFDFEGDINPLAINALASISIHSYGIGDEQPVLQGPILLVTED